MDAIDTIENIINIPKDAIIDLIVVSHSETLFEQ